MEWKRGEQRLFKVMGREGGEGGGFNLNSNFLLTNPTVLVQGFSFAFSALTFQGIFSRL